MVSFERPKFLVLIQSNSLHFSLCIMFLCPICLYQFQVHKDDFLCFSLLFLYPSPWHLPSIWNSFSCVYDVMSRYILSPKNIQLIQHHYLLLDLFSMKWWYHLCQNQGIILAAGVSLTSKFVSWSVCPCAETHCCNIYCFKTMFVTSWCKCSSLFFSFKMWGFFFKQKTMFGFHGVYCIHSVIVWHVKWWSWIECRPWVDS